eukprot:2217470-Pleurochrysis_carterae.AAC.1
MIRPRCGRDAIKKRPRVRARLCVLCRGVRELPDVLCAAPAEHVAASEGSGRRDVAQAALAPRSG